MTSTYQRKVRFALNDHAIWIQQRLSTVKQENKETLESIKDLQILLKQHKKGEAELRDKIMETANEAQKHLDRAVTTYEEREEFINRKNMYEERCSQDLRKAAVNESALKHILEKTQKFEDFGDLQKKPRSDSRIATTGALIEQGITGLEPELNRAHDLHSAIVTSSGRSTPEQIDEHFQLTDDQANSKFCYLEDLMEQIHREQKTVDELREKNKKLQMRMSEKERRMRWEIKEAQGKANQSRSEANATTKMVAEAKAEMNILLDKFHSLYLKCSSGEQKVTSFKQKDKFDSLDVLRDPGRENEQIDDSNALEFLEKFEEKILEYLQLIEYTRMKESMSEEKPQQLIDTDEDEPIIEPPKVEYLDTIGPRLLETKSDPRCTPDLHHEHVFPTLEELKSKAVAAVAEIEAGGSTEEEY